MLCFGTPCSLTKAVTDFHKKTKKRRATSILFVPYMQGKEVHLQHYAYVISHLNHMIVFDISCYIWNNKIYSYWLKILSTRVVFYARWDTAPVSLFNVNNKSMTVIFFSLYHMIIKCHLGEWSFLIMSFYWRWWWWVKLLGKISSLNFVAKAKNCLRDLQNMNSKP